MTSLRRRGRDEELPEIHTAGGDQVCWRCGQIVKVGTARF